jgi:hypothetical protein
MYDAFIDALNSIYWEGYAEQLAQDNPKAFNAEMNNFFDNFC